MTLTLTANGVGVSRVELTIPKRGVWFAELEIPDGVVSGAVTLVIGSSTLRGTVDADHSGEFGGRQRVRVIGGAGGWGKPTKKLALHNDAGIRAREIAAGVAQEVGETLGDFAPSAERVGVDYSRDAGYPASVTLADVIGSASWWVGLDGITRVGTRVAPKISAENHEVLSFDPISRDATIACDFVAVEPGAVVSNGLAAPLSVGAVRYEITPDALRCSADCDANAVTSHEADAFAAAVLAVIGRRLGGIYAYRVGKMTADRVDLQAVSLNGPHPNLTTVSMWSAPGIHAQLSPGSEVRVAFVDEDPAQPCIVGFAPKGSPGHVPVKLQLAGGGQSVARIGDLVTCGGPGTVVSFGPVTGSEPPVLTMGTPYTISFSPVPPVGPVDPLCAPLYGSISTGSGITESG